MFVSIPASRSQWRLRDIFLIFYLTLYKRLLYTSSYVLFSCAPCHASDDDIFHDYLRANVHPLHLLCSSNLPLASLAAHRPKELRVELEVVLRMN
jgi:hypothetical protein